MRRVYADQLQQVQVYLSNSNRRSLFDELQKSIVLELRRTTENPKLAQLISEVFCRADKDPKHPIKSDKKIAIKLYKWSKSAGSSERPKPQDVHDIAGVTVVCNYPSDTDEIARFIEKSEKFRDFSVEKMRFIDPVESGGYRAYHAIATGKGKYRGLHCEIQIKTLLTMSWGAKTHDLTYKPSGSVDPRLNTYMVKMTSVAQILDEQSEILKNLILSANELEQERKATARAQLLQGVASSTDSVVQELLESVKTEAARISVADLDDDLLSSILEKIDRHIKDNGASREMCRIAALIALSRPYLDFNDWAIEKADDWILSYPDGSADALRALNFRSAICMSLGEYEESIVTARATVEGLKKIGNISALPMANANLAYYLSEAYFHRAFDEASGGGEIIRDATDACATEALAIVDNLVLTCGLDESLDHRILDSLGAVLIVCAEFENDVRRGLTYCQEARHYAKGKTWEHVAESFFSLHEKRAFRRLLTFK
ncbi:MAG: RelA/SpoT domain-containing protein [Tabrizicola sp.]|jgi:ppGpp synthetase/RelA/SpoT-type nucleotidyltranferase|nr:RelA/SpoT domain-containing protein [Tabrizicola sp.]